MLYGVRSVLACRDALAGSQVRRERGDLARVEVQVGHSKRCLPTREDTLRVGQNLGDVVLSPTSRVVAAVVVLATIPIATTASAGLHLAAVVVVVTAMLLIDARRAATGTSYDLRAAS
jgi:hypothetical protein